MYKYNVGIDISKADFVVAVHGKKAVEVYRNTEEGFLLFFKAHQKTLSKSLVVLETTGGYEQSLLAFLLRQHIAVHRASGRQIKNFIRSYGKQAKTDKIDALAIARYSYERQSSLDLYQAKSETSQQLSALVHRRMDLVQMLVQEKNRLKAPSHEELKPMIIEHIAYIEKAINKIEEAIGVLRAKDADYAAKEKELTSISGVGIKTAFMLLALVPELGSISRRQIASLTGVAPHPQESGQKKGYSYTLGGRRDVRPILYTAALAAAKSKSRLGDWYRQLIANGKKPLVAIVALMRKIILIANAKIRDLTLLKHS
jgi:transposase